MSETNSNYIVGTEDLRQMTSKRLEDASAWLSKWMLEHPGHDPFNPEVVELLKRWDNAFLQFQALRKSNEDEQPGNVPAIRREDSKRKRVTSEDHDIGYARKRQRTKDKPLEHFYPHYQRLREFTMDDLNEYTIDQLMKMGTWVDAPSIQGEEPFWSEEKQAEASAIRKHDEFETFMAPIWTDLLAKHDMVQVSSKAYDWLPMLPFTPEKTILKPRSFATHPAMYHSLSTSINGAVDPHGGRFGVPHQELNDCVILIESSLNISDNDFAKIVLFLQTVSRDGLGGALLYDRRQFLLVSSNNGGVFRVLRSKWTTDGSKALLNKFFDDHKSPLVPLLQESCHKLGVQIEENAFLGRGGHGCVFKVSRGVATFALKIVKENSLPSLFDEHLALKRAAQWELAADPTGKLVECRDGGALLLWPVGTPLPIPTTRREVVQLFAMLFELHKRGISHGDARVSNIIVADGFLRWIGFSGYYESEASSGELYEDTKRLVRSILQLPVNENLDEFMLALMHNYSDDPTRPQIEYIASVIGDELGFDKN